MNIAILHYHRIGGSGVVAYELGRAFATLKNATIHFIGLEQPFYFNSNDSKNIFFHQVCIKNYPVFDHQPYSLALASQLADIIDEYDIDVIHSHYALPHAISAILARDIAKKKVKCVTTLHGTDITIVGSHPSMTNITRYAIEKSDAVNTVSRFLKNETVNRFNINPNKIHVIHNFINPLTVSHCPYTSSKKPNQIRKLVHISNLREIKLPVMVIEIFNLIHQKKENVELDIVGDGPLKIEMQKKIKEFGLEKKVHFLGIRNDIPNVLEKCDLLISPCKVEAFGLVILEAMTCGTPSLASNAGGVPEIIKDGENGLLFEPDNIQDASKKALSILNNTKAYKTMSQKAFNSAREKFSIDKAIKKYEELYKRN